jgi:hypothetical protein
LIDLYNRLGNKDIAGSQQPHHFNLVAFLGLPLNGDIVRQENSEAFDNP